MVKNKKMKNGQEVAPPLLNLCVECEPEERKEEDQPSHLPHATNPEWVPSIKMRNSSKTSKFHRAKNRKKRKLGLDEDVSPLDLSVKSDSFKQHEHAGEENHGSGASSKKKTRSVHSSQPEREGVPGSNIQRPDESVCSVSMVMRLRVFPDETYDTLIVPAEHFDGQKKDTSNLGEQDSEIVEKDCNSRIAALHCGLDNRKENPTSGEKKPIGLDFVLGESLATKDKCMHGKKHRGYEKIDDVANINPDQNVELHRTTSFQSSAEFRTKKSTDIEQSSQLTASSSAKPSLSGINSAVDSQVRPSSLEKITDIVGQKTGILDLSLPVFTVSEKTASSSNKKVRKQESCNQKTSSEITSFLAERKMADGRFLCVECQTIWPYEKEFLRHTNRHKVKKVITHPCELCGKIFDLARELFDHQVLDHRIIYKCDICGMEFLKEINFKHHKENSHKKSPGIYVCKVCNKTFKKYDKLHTHLNHHDELKTCFCKVCGKGFAFQGQLNAHSRRHTDEKKYQCEECGQALKGSDALRKHLLKHKGIKPYTCDICGKKLASVEGFKSHVMAHEGPPPFKCDLCDKGYYTLGNLKNHKKDKHDTISSKDSLL